MPDGDVASATVAAVVCGSGPALDAVERQDHAPDRVLAHGGPWRDAILAAAGQADWLWLVAGDVEPEPSALGALLELVPARAGLPEPVLLAGKVVDPDGRLDAASAPWPPLHDRAAGMAAAEHGVAAVRIARWGSLLVPRSAIERHGLPRPALARGGDDIEWTARLLRWGHGYLVPGSVALRGQRDGRAPREAAGVARALASREAWAPYERLWVLYTVLLEGSRRSPSRKPRRIVRTLARLPWFARR